MKTSKPISTISYNSREYLRSTLIYLCKSGVITFGCFIEHKGESDESSKKDHFHVYIEPSSLIQTDDLISQFDEVVSHKVIPFRLSKFSDWYMYGLHDRAYLRSKFLTREHHYSDVDFWATSMDYLDYLRSDISMFENSAIRLIKEAITAGLSFDQLLVRGSVPISQVRAYKFVYDQLKSISLEGLFNE